MNKRFLLNLTANRVRRNYRGGAQLDILEGVQNPMDSERPEDWIASTVEAKNPGLCPIENEGLTKINNADGTRTLLRDLLADAPEHYLGTAHFKKLGTNTGFLAKFLDSSMRLHVQAHPRADFAQKYLNSRWGKLETYVILGTRKGIDPYIRLGFQKPPSPKEWRRIVLEQDIAAMDACFEKIPVKEGEVWVVPGGLPHAIGEGLLVMEVMEPTDLVVRCEFEREGIVVPPAGRFMGKDPDFALQIFDFSPMPLEKLHAECRVTPKLIYENKGTSKELLIGSEQTDCFNEYRVRVTDRNLLPLDGRMSICAVSAGAGEIKTGNEKIIVRRGSKFLIAAAAENIEIIPDGNLEFIICNAQI